MRLRREAGAKVFILPERREKFLINVGINFLMSYDYPANTWGEFGVISCGSETGSTAAAVRSASTSERERREAPSLFSYSHLLPIFRDLLGNLVLPSRRRIDLLTLTKVN